MSEDITDSAILSCSFCFKKENEVKLLIAGNEKEGEAQAHICDRCVTGSVLEIDRHIKAMKKLTKDIQKTRASEGAGRIAKPDDAIQLIENPEAT